MNAKSVTGFIILLLTINQAHSRSLQSEEMCTEVYGFLPCSNNAWGLLFMIIVYEILLSIAGQYVGMGSSLFFELIGPGIIGSSVFRLLGTIPQILLVLVSSLTAPKEVVERQLTFSMGLVAGSTTMLLTLVWGVSTIVGSYDLSILATSGQQQYIGNHHLKGVGIVTDAETSFTARQMLHSTVPVILLVVAIAIPYQTVKRIIILVDIVLTFVYLITYCVDQIFEPWIKERRFDSLMGKYAKNKLLKLVSKNGKPDDKKIKELFDLIDKDKSGSVCEYELKVLLLGVEFDKDNLETQKDIEDIMEAFDTIDDDKITLKEFTQGITKLSYGLTDKETSSSKTNNYQGDGETRQQLLIKREKARRTNVLLDYARALALVIAATAILMFLGQPLTSSVVAFSQVAHLPEFLVSFFLIPLAMNYGVAVQSITSASQKSKKSISLTLSALYGSVYMNNIVGLISFLVPVYVRDLSMDVISEAVVVLLVCVVMSSVASFNTKFPRWAGYVGLLNYVISLVLIYVLTSVLRLP